MKVEFRYFEVKFNDKPEGSNDVGDVTVSEGNVVLPCPACDELLGGSMPGVGLDGIP
jgi:hypothetical protein